MIKSILFYLFRTGEYYTFSKRIIAIIDTELQKIPEVSEVLAKLKRAHKLLDESIEKSTPKIYTEMVVEADEQRDHALSAWKLYLLACKKRVKKGWNEPASLLIETMRKYGWSIERESFTNESSKINNILIDIKTVPQLSEAVNTLNSQDWINEIKYAQINFEKLELERVEARAELSEEKSEEVCKDIRSSFDIIFNYINVMQQIKSNEAFVPMIKQVNEVISEFNSSIRMRQKRSENKTVEI